MDVAVVGGHGKVAQRLLRLLAANGHRARGIVRNPDHTADLRRIGAQAIVADLEQDADLTAAIHGSDAVVFAAGAGPGSGPARKQTVDLGGAVRLIQAAVSESVRRYVMVSAMGARNPSGGPTAMRPYLEAKSEADERVAMSGLAYTIVRPGSLTEEAGTGLISASEELGRRGEIPRDDVAVTLLAVLEHDSTIAKTFEVISGDTPIPEAIRAL